MNSQARSEHIASTMCWRGAAPLSRLSPTNAGTGLAGIDDLHRAAMQALEQQRRFATARFAHALAEAASKLSALRCGPVSTPARDRLRKTRRHGQ